MMGTGEAEGDNRAIVATEIALNNPLIDEYSLKGAKGLLVNITGGSDLTLFEVDAAVNKIRAEVDPEAELITGAFTDENLKGKIRVSIVATALDGHKKANTIINVGNRFGYKNSDSSDNLFTRTTNFENNTLNSINGATALKLDQEVETVQQNQNLEEEPYINTSSDVLPDGVSIESASYIENNVINDLNLSNNEKILDESTNVVEEDNTPKLFNEIKSSEEATDQNQDNYEDRENLFDTEDKSEEMNLKYLPF